MIQIDFVAIICLNVLPLTIEGHQVHVEQTCRAIDVERTGRNTEFGQVGGLVVGITGGGNHKESFARSHLRLNSLEQFSEGLIKAQVGVLHLHRELAHRLVFIIARIIGQGEIVGDVVVTNAGGVDAFRGKLRDIFVDESAGGKSLEAMVTLELVFERFLHSTGGEVTEVAAQFRQWFPRIALQERFQVILFVGNRHPAGQWPIVGGATPTSGERINPKGSIGRMSGTENGSVTEGGNGINNSLSFCSHFQFVTNG